MNDFRQWLLEAEGDLAQLSNLADSLDHAELIESLIELLATDPDTHKSASWLLKHLVERGIDLTQAQAAHTRQALDQLQHWEAKLHMLQLASKSKTLTPEAIADWAFQSMGSSNKFLEAWAMFISVIGFCKTDPKRSQELLKQALANDSAAIRARAKKAASIVAKLNSN